MARTKLSRRTLLRGMLASGAAVTVGLPLLDIFCNDNGNALAAGGAFPQRFGIFFWGNGNIPERWIPTGQGTGAAWSLSEQLAPLASVKSKITVVSGCSVKTANSEAHTAGAAGIFTGTSPLVVGTRKTFASASLDQVFADRIGDATRFRSIETTCDSTLGFTTGDEGPHANGGHSYTGPDARVEPEFSPHALFNRIFGPGFALPNQNLPPDPTLALRKSVLDYVGDDLARLRPRLGKEDRIRLDDHLEGVRRIETRLENLAATPANLVSCALPMAPDADSAFYPVEGRAQMQAYNRAFTDLLAMALACDQTRVMSHWFSASVSRVLYPRAPAEHHSLTHDEGDSGPAPEQKQPLVNDIVIQIMDELAYMIRKFDSVQEGAGTMLDNMVLFATSDCALGRTHELSRYPILLAGSAGGKLVTDTHLVKVGANASQVPLTLLQAFDSSVSSWGTDDGHVTDPLSELFVP